MMFRGGDRIAQAADVHVVEILVPSLPDADQSGGMRNRIAAGSRALERRGVANVGVYQRSRQSAAGGASREDDQIVSTGGERAYDGASQIAGAAGHEHFHRVRM